MRGSSHPHAMVLAAALGVMVATGVALDAVAARDPRPGRVWLVTADPVPAWRTVLRHPGTRVVRSWAGGRLALLDVEALDDVPRPPAALVWRAALPTLALPGCG